ncbi:MAG: hypothetical protein U0470_00730 [Anaerolineae bacterium]
MRSTAAAGAASEPSAPAAEKTIEIGGRVTALVAALVLVALLGGIAVRFARSAAGARMRRSC